MINRVKISDLYKDMLNKFKVDEVITSTSANITKIIAIDSNDNSLKSINSSFIDELNLVKKSVFNNQINYFYDYINSVK
jgi:hypothetical protein